MGAIALGLLGAGVGALAGGRNGALIGLGAGAALGGAIGVAMGYVVARKNYLQARTEDTLKQLIAAANLDADAYHRSATASRDIAAEARIKTLPRWIRNIGRRQSPRNNIGDPEAMSYQVQCRISRKVRNVASSTEKVTAMRTDAQSQTGESRAELLNDAHQVDLARRALKESSDSLAATLAMVPS